MVAVTVGMQHPLYRFHRGSSGWLVPPLDVKNEAGIIQKTDGFWICHHECEIG
jgi:hypothetical protein